MILTPWLQPPKFPLPCGHRPTPAPCTLHHWPHVLSSVALVATPAEGLASNKNLEFNGDVKGSWPSYSYLPAWRECGDTCVMPS